MGTKIEKETISYIKEIIKETKFVEGIHKIFLHDYGTNKVITLHVEIESKLSIEKAHSIADILEQKIQEKTNCSTVIHLEPKNKKTDTKKENKIIEKILKTQKEVKSYHKIQIIKGIGKDEIKMHLIVKHDMPVKKAHDLCHKIENILQRAYGSCKVDVHFEPCGNNCNICKISCKDKR